MSQKSKRILFIAECVTLAHMARPAVLAESLKAGMHEVIFASDGRYDRLFGYLPFQSEHVFSISSGQFLTKLSRGHPLYDEETLQRYVKDDLALFDRTRPDVVIGDFRLSLSVSARVARIPYVAISNIYWSPYAKQYYPVPEIPITRVLGVSLAQMLFSMIRPIAFALHTRPLNTVRKQFGLAPLGSDLRKTYTDADLTLYADIPGLVRTEALPSNHRYIGPVLWSPHLPTPDWWDLLDTSRPVIYLTLGSSGNVEELRAVSAALASLPATVIVATAGRAPQNLDISGVFAADFLPGELAARRADLVVCNGGSPTTAQALAAGTPILGLPSNLDQYLNMNALANAGLGIMLRSTHLTPQRLRAAANEVLHNQGFRERTAKIARTFQASATEESFSGMLSDFIQTHCRPPV